MAPASPGPGASLRVRFWPPPAMPASPTTGLVAGVAARQRPGRVGPGPPSGRRYRRAAAPGEGSLPGRPATRWGTTHRPQPALDSLSFLVVQDLYLTATAERAHVVLPAQSFVEREGSLTTGERRVQRFYPAVPPLGETRPIGEIAGALGARLGAAEPPASAADCMEQIAAAVPAYAQTSYAALAEVDEQWPLVRRRRLVFRRHGLRQPPGSRRQAADGHRAGEQGGGRLA